MHSNCTLRLEKNLTKDLGPCWIVTSRPLNVAEVFWIKNKKGAFAHKSRAFVRFRCGEPYLGNFNHICLHMQCIFMYNKQTA